MLEILKYMSSGFWVWIGTITILYILLYFVGNILSRGFSRFLRTINILFRGWPPTHLDADGDQVETNEK